VRNVKKSSIFGLYIKKGMYIVWAERDFHTTYIWLSFLKGLPGRVAASSSFLDMIS